MHRPFLFRRGLGQCEYHKALTIGRQIEIDGSEVGNSQGLSYQARGLSGRDQSPSTL